MPMRWVKAAYTDEDFIHQVELARLKRDKVHLWWLGQSGFLFQWNDIHVLIDPYLSDSLTRKYENSAHPHVRMSEKVIEPQKLTFIDIVTSSHNHTDHLDGDTLIPLIKANPGIGMIIPEANREFVCQRIGAPSSFPIGLNDKETITVKNIRFTGIPAAHNELDRDDQGRCRYMGWVMELGGKKIYHSGDTLLYTGMEELLSTFQIDLAILPINGNDPSRGVAGNLNCEEAAWLGRSIGAGLVIPCHYDMFTFNTADVAEFSVACKREDVPFYIMDIGGGFVLD